MVCVLEDGRVIPEHDFITCPYPATWRDPATVTQEEIEAWRELAGEDYDRNPNNPDAWPAVVHIGTFTFMTMAQKELGKEDYTMEELLGAVSEIIERNSVSLESEEGPINGESGPEKAAKSDFLN